MKGSTAIEIVMVDDDPEDIFLLRRALRNANIVQNFKGIESGDELFEYLGETDSELPKLILIDINMPGLNGYQVLRKLRANQDWSAITVAMLSTSTLEADKKKAFANGADQFFSKPVSVAESNVLTENLKSYFSDDGS